ncbi:hypothetical protein GCM10009738_35730 [Kitasatospora viridis]
MMLAPVSNSPPSPARVQPEGRVAAVGSIAFSAVPLVTAPEPPAAEEPVADAEAESDGSAELDAALVGAVLWVGAATGGVGFPEDEHPDSRTTVANTAPVAAGILSLDIPSSVPGTAHGAVTSGSHEVVSGLRPAAPDPAAVPRAGAAVLRATAHRYRERLS